MCPFQSIDHAIMCCHLLAYNRTPSLYLGAVVLTLLVLFEQNNLIVPIESKPWPVDRAFRVSVNSFGIGGANAHVSHSIQTWIGSITVT